MTELSPAAHLNPAPLVEEPTSTPMAESWPSKIHFPGGDLPDGEYVIDADILNEQYNIALKNFDLSEVHEEGSPLYIYFRAMWLGYAAAAAGIRNYVRNNPASPGATR